MWFFDRPDRQGTLHAAALKWLGTPFVCGASVKGCGVDCCHLVAGLLVECGLPHRFSPPRYALDYGFHNERSLVTEYMEATRLFAVVNDGSWLPGDVFGFRIGRCVHHVGVRLDEETFCQAVSKFGTVISQIGDGTFSSRLVTTWRALEGEAS